MTQADYNLTDQSRSNYRIEHNTINEAIVTLNSGPTEPATTFAGMLWLDTTNKRVRQRNEANNGWLTRWSWEKEGALLSLAVDPSGSTGELWYNFSDKRLKVYSESGKREVPSAVLMPGWHNGPLPEWVSDSSVRIPANSSSVDFEQKRIARVDTALVADLSTSGANGLDTGAEANNTWYYLWLCEGSSGQCSLFSLSNTAPVLPAGYNDYKHLMPDAWRNDGSGNLLRKVIKPGGATEYKGYPGGLSGYAPSLEAYTGTDTSKRTISLASLIPPGCTDVELQVITSGNTVTAYHEDDASKAVSFQGFAGRNFPFDNQRFVTNASQEIGANANTAGFTINVVGYYLNQGA